MVTNPPWGERMTGDGDIDQLYREVGQTLATTSMAIESRSFSVKMHLSENYSSESNESAGYITVRSNVGGSTGKSGRQEINYTANSAV